MHIGVNSTEGYYHDRSVEMNDDGYRYVVMLIFMVFLVGLGFCCGWKMSKRWHGLCSATSSTVTISVSLSQPRPGKDVAIQHERPEVELCGAATQCARPVVDPEAIQRLTIDAIRAELRETYQQRRLPSELRKGELVEILQKCRAEDTR